MEGAGSVLCRRIGGKQDPASRGIMSGRAVVILCVIVLARLALGVQFQSAGSVAPDLIRAFDLDNAGLGLLVGVFWLPGVVLTLPSGLLAQRLGDRPVVLGGLVLMAAGAVLSGLASTAFGFGLGRVVSGTGIAVVMAPLMKVLADWFTGPLLYRTLSLFIVAWPVGIAATQASLGWLAAATGDWRAALWADVGFTLLATVVFAVLYRASPALAGAPVGAERMTGREVWLTCLAGAGWMTINAAYFVALTFAPLLLVERGQATPAAAGVAVSLMSWVFLIGLPLGGVLVSRLRVPTAWAAGAFALSALAALALVLDAPPVPALVVHGLAFALAVPVISAQPLHALRPGTRAAGLGLYYVWYYVGAAAMPPIAGILKDDAGPVMPILFVIALIMATIAIMVWFALERRRPAV